MPTAATRTIAHNQRSAYDRWRNIEREICHDFSAEAAAEVKLQIAAGKLLIPPGTAEIARKIATLAKATDPAQASDIERFVIAEIESEWKLKWQWEWELELKRQMVKAEPENDDEHWHSSRFALKTFNDLAHQIRALLGHPGVLWELKSALSRLWRPDDFEMRGWNTDQEEEALKETVALLVEVSREALENSGEPCDSGFDPEEPFCAFVLRLLEKVRAAGGRLTLNKNLNSGSMLETIPLLRSVFPADFMPKSVPILWLSRLKKLDNVSRNSEAKEHIKSS
jgi:hypothetical protein